MTTHTFTLDPFQKEAIEALKNGVSVVVSAPTGSGKTAIAEFVIEEALKTHERVFYTTPLKALSNQKFHDFQKKYGEEKIGILTGDTAINRDGQILVMTTEIYRNMLYGTVVGLKNEDLKHLRYVVLDECHYMNDPERGTVWEESIIYSPKDIQILALSATIQNAKELTDWISNIHNNTQLIESFIRPVPLRFYYFKEKNIVPLLTTDKKLNPNLIEHKDSFKAHRQKFHDQRRFHEHKLARVIDVVKELSKKALLPAIYFVFSRRGCEISLKDCQQLGFSLLTEEERKTLSKLIQERIHGNEYLLKHRHLGFLYQGLAVHHAGLLPQWKEIVEELFSKGLIKVVFATETLAAGINMPAKTTIISNLGKRGDTGHKNLTASEFLQMSGRAGRRGMDKIGNVIVKETPDHSPAFASKLATSTSDPLRSQFTPNYAMALNLLQNHSTDEINNLLNKSFGQYLIKKDLKIHYERKIHIEEKTKIKDPKKYEGKLKAVSKYIDEQEHFFKNWFLKILRILTRCGYLQNNIPTEKGIIAASLRGENILFLSEVLLNCNFQNLRPEEFAACMSCLALDEGRPRIYSRLRHSYMVDDTFIQMQRVMRNIIKLQRDYALDVTIHMNPILSGMVEKWCKDDTTWDDLLSLTNMDEGDIVRGMRRTMDLLRHIKNGPHLKKELTDLAKYGLEMMDKEPVRENL